MDESSRKNSFKMQTLDGAFDGQLSAALGKQAGLGIEAFSGTTLPFCAVGAGWRGNRTVGHNACLKLTARNNWIAPHSRLPADRWPNTSAEPLKIFGFSLSIR